MHLREQCPVVIAAHRRYGAGGSDENSQGRKRGGASGGEIGESAAGRLCEGSHWAWVIDVAGRFSVSVSVSLFIYCLISSGGPWGHLLGQNVRLMHTYTYQWLGLAEMGERVGAFEW